MTKLSMIVFTLVIFSERQLKIVTKKEAKKILTLSQQLTNRLPQQKKIDAINMKKKLKIGTFINK